MECMKCMECIECVDRTTTLVGITFFRYNSKLLICNLKFKSEILRCTSIILGCNIMFI